MKQTVKTGVKSRSNFDLSQNHLTTMDFGSIQPSFITEVVPNDTLHITMKSFARLAPLAVPTFGKISCTSRAFFVPMRSIWRPFEDWIDRSNDPSLQHDFPVIRNDEFVKFFFDDTLSYVVSTLTEYDDSIKCDFIVPKVFAPQYKEYRNFTNRGRWFYKILLSLGYSINFDLDPDGTSGTHVDITDMSALPLLAFLRICYDYIFPSQYVNGLSLGSLFEDYVSSDAILSAFKDIVCAPFAQDYFTSAWKDINQVGDSDNVVISKVTIDAHPNRVISSASSTAKLEQHANGITAMGLRLLSAVSDFVTRNNIAGSRYFEQLLARFGISSPKASPNRAMYIRSFEDPVSIQDVTATATTDFSVLGEQGAKGIQSSVANNEFSVSSEDTYGYIIILSHVAPDTGYYQGRKRHTLHLSQFDFFTPEFEDVGLQPIRNDELFADFKNSRDFFNGYEYGGTPSGVFGFAPRYVEYKKREDYLTGDFRLNSVNTGLDSYHLFRNLPTPSLGAPLSLNSNFLLCAQHEFDRIFQQPTVPIQEFNFRYLPDGSLRDYKFLFYGNSIINFSVDSDKRFIIGVDYNGKFIIFFRKNSSTYSSVYNSLYTLILQGVITVVSSSSLGITINSTLSNDDLTLTGSLLFSPSVYLHFEGLSSSGQYTYLVPSSISDPNCIQPIYRDDSLLPVSEDSFINAFSDYFDHFYTIFRFDVNANRSMQSISESMPIDDGGSPVKVDYEGFNFSV